MHYVINQKCMVVLLGELSPSAWFDRMERHKAQAKRNQESLHVVEHGLTHRERERRNKMYTKEYHMSNKVDKKRMRAEAMSKDLGRYL